MTTGTLNSYTDTGNNERGIADVINNIDWREAPLLRILGFSNKNVSKFNLVGWPNTKAELIEDTMPAYTTTLAEALDNSETDWDVAAGTGQYFRKGDVVGVLLSGEIAEKAVVVSVATDTLTVQERGYGDTSATTHNSGATIAILTRAMPEGADYTTGYTTLTTQPYNYTQILSEAVKVTRTAQRMSKYGIEDYMDYQVAKLFDDGGQAGRLAQLLQRTFYYGERVQRTGTYYGSMGGFETFVTTNVQDLNGEALQKSHIHRAIRDIRQAGGKVDYLVTGSEGIEIVSQLYEDSIRTTRDEKIGGHEIETILTPHGQVKLVYDWMCPNGRYYLANSAKAGWLPFDEFKRGDIETQGDYHVTDVVGEYTFLVANEKSHAIIKEAAAL